MRTTSRKDPRTGNIPRPAPLSARSAAEWTFQLGLLPASVRATVARIIWWDYSETCPGLNEALAWSLDVPFEPAVTDRQIRDCLFLLGYHRTELPRRIRRATRDISLGLRLGHGVRRSTDQDQLAKPAQRYAAWATWSHAA